ncbi:TPA: DNA sulfur modification protein DndD [Vibrio parahaemolyticus]|uniref:DNA sulfur modification protein DndD n=1 Tax=Vibrio parahaemolyticus TaxID=670 RepID=UPI00193F7339|nr:DNA sulfur modification protein DndD [Vibrio parahaemolyticus]EGQ7686067.1 DNA sulfur modification protein DndD [Vibrio parahaemolyticus]EGQ8186114.1 DNA sulfur modification protein DndD [Vibrio parahaemolyticus]EGQ8542312.1 DNA sulfur modification protein DndD [Vibrio parahaemolyticus]EHH1030022.1 DNA sulfur modification protein DndD [Vibrio parahaemolyticus]EJG0663120.1 DNA sulfur modification protein DndD [Vibrio parahaemolyticus]
MIFEQVKLYNFGIYQGEHIVDLNVTDHTKPIILFGGLNGGGKTTFLDSLQLALYGKNAKCSNRGKLSYSDYLKQAINRYSEDKSAFVALTFRHTQRTEANRYEVIRSWEVSSNKEITDKLQVLVNGELDNLLTDNWSDFVSEFIPQSMSELFFFDGEKIEDLADPSRSAQLLKTGIEALLGLELFTQLSKDLNNQKRRRQERNLDNSSSKKVDDLKQRKELLENNLLSIEENIQKILDDENDLANQLKDIEVQMQTSGANLLDDVNNIQLERKAVASKLEAIDHNLIKLAAGAMPLAIAHNLLKETKEQALLEDEVIGFDNAQKHIKANNDELIKRLKASTTDDMAEEVNKLLSSIWEESKDCLNQEKYLNVNPVIFDFAESAIESDTTESAELLKQKRELQETLALLDKKLDAVPDSESVKEQIEAKGRIEASIAHSKTTLDSLMEEMAQCKTQINENEARLDATLIQQNAEDFEGRRNEQVAEHLVEMKEIVDAFKAQLIKENISKLEKRIKSKFDSLERKSELVAKVKINPETFNLTLLGLDGLALDTKRLSAGERQLLSVAILWALAEASGKEIPTIIDTPMGRLDGKHRTKLVENYFPEAAGQVILLSTDEEIAGQYYKKLKRSVAKEYHISYEEAAKTSTITEGYFGELA